MKRALTIAVLLIASHSCIAALCSYQHELKTIEQLQIGSQERHDAIDRLLKVKQTPSCFMNYLASKGALPTRSGLIGAMQLLQSSRTDVQEGSSTGTGGTTSLVSKGVTAQVLSVAAEYGALAESVNKQVVTVQGSLNGIPTALIRKSIVLYCPPGMANTPGCIHEGFLRALRRVSYGVSFDTSPGAQSLSATPATTSTGPAQAVTFTAAGKQVTQATGKVALWNTRDITSKEYVKQWNDQLGKSKTISDAGSNLADALRTLGDLEANPDYQQWFKEADAALTAASNATLPAVFEIEMSKLQLVLKALPGFDQHMAEFAQALGAFVFEEENLVSSISDKPVLTLQYAYSRPTGQNPRSSFGLLFDKGFGDTSVTCNIVAEVNNGHLANNVPGLQRLRDTQAAIQIDRRIGFLSFIGANAVSGAYYFQHQTSPAVLTVNPGQPIPGVTFINLPSGASQVFAEKGNLHIGQLKLVIGAGTSSVRFPLSISYSSRTELIAHPSWRGQIGVSYDFDSLFSK